MQTPAHAATWETEARTKQVQGHPVNSLPRIPHLSQKLTPSAPAGLPAKQEGTPLLLIQQLLTQRWEAEPGTGLRAAQGVFLPHHSWQVSGPLG